MKPGEFRILKVLYEEGPQTFTELEKKAQLTPPPLSEYLKSLQKSFLVIKNDSNKYEIPKVFIEKSDISEVLLNKISSQTNFETIDLIKSIIWDESENSTTIKNQIKAWLVFLNFDILNYLSNLPEINEPDVIYENTTKFLNDTVIPFIRLLSIVCLKKNKAIPDINELFPEGIKFRELTKEERKHTKTIKIPLEDLHQKVGLNVKKMYNETQS